MRFAIVSLCILGLVTSSAWAANITIDTVLIGNAGNPNDPQTGSIYGGVSYNYRMGTAEVTVGQYTAFLNAVAATDTYELYRTQMTTDLKIAGVLRSGAPGSYSYSVIGSPDKPIAWTNWGNAVRFANWMQNGQPTGPQIASTTEDGAYTLNGAKTNDALLAVTRNPGATWFIPSEDEWYKAAYHKNDGASANYWRYATSTNSAPYSDQPPGLDAPIQSNTANFYADDGLANGYNDGYAVTASNSSSNSLNYLTEVGAYAAAASPYGTFDQGGNVGEWTEGKASGFFRIYLGGAWSDFGVYLQATGRRSLSPLNGGSANGFRVATVPEPSSALLAILAASICWWWRNRR